MKSASAIAGKMWLGGSLALPKRLTLSSRRRVSPRLASPFAATRPYGLGGSLALPKRLALPNCVLPIFVACLLLVTLSSIAPAQSLNDLLEFEVQPKVVKIYGAGGIRGLEAYQSGFLISADGHVLTTWSHVLDTEYITVVLADGRRFTGELLVGADPRLEIAVLKIDAQDLSHFQLHESTELAVGDRVLALSNLFGVATGNEPASVLHGIVSAKTDLAARSGAFESVYKGQVYVLDAMTNNPGAAGGALVDWNGRLAGLLGKELRNSLDNTWLNYAIPASELEPAVAAILSGEARPLREESTAQKATEPLSLDLLGLALVPDVIAKTPPFIDFVQRDSPASRAGLRTDDLVLFLNDRLVDSCRALRAELSYIDRLDKIRLTVQRGQQLLDVELQASDDR